MFHNLTLQRAVASVLLASFATGLAAPAAAQARVAIPMVGKAPLVPLQAPARHAPAFDANGIPTGKGMRRVAHAEPAGAAVSAAAPADAFDALHALARKGRKGAAKADPLALARAMKAQYAAVQEEEKEIAGDFAATEKYLREHGVPAEIIKRHQGVVGDFGSRREGLRGAVASLDTAKTATAAQAAIDSVARQLDKYAQHAHKAQQRDGALPWGQSRRASMKVALTPREHEARFPQSIQLAALGTLSGIRLPDAPLPPEVQPADLAASDDVPAAAPQIVALAASLGQNPVAIHNWVRNEIRFAPGFGAMQGALGALQSRRGNDVDTASLLVALYRAAGIPARYAYGTIEVPGARMQNWLGVDNNQAVLTLLTQAGIPNRLAGQAIQLEHVWVEAFVDLSPSRGAVNKAAGAWMALDPSFKQMDVQRGLDLQSAVGMNEAGLFDSAKQGATCTVDYARNLNLANLQQAYTDYKTALAAALAKEGSDLTVGQVLGGSVIAAENYGILLGSLPYKTIAQGALLNVLPEQLRWRLRVQLFASAADQEAGQSAAAFSADLSSVADRRLTLSFVPATQADADTLAAYMPRPHADGSPVQPSEFPQTVPGYLVRVKAEIRAGGEVVASGGSFVLGSELVADIGAYDPSANDWTDSTFYPNAGEYHALAVDAQGVSAERLNAIKARLNAVHARLAAGQGETLARDDVAGELLYQGALAYFASADANAALFQRAAGVVDQRLPSYGRAVAQVRPEMAYGIVRSVSFPGVALDIDRSSSAVASNTRGVASGAYVRQANLRNAAYAHQVLAQLFTSAQQPGQAVSPISSIAGAAAAGQPVYEVTAANGAAVLPQVSLTAGAAAQLQNDVAGGLRATVAQAPVSVGGWTGQGVAVVDPTTGAANYRLTGDADSATAALYPAAGMGWLALGEPSVSAAALIPAALAAQSMDANYAAMLGSAGYTTRWSFFPGQAEVGNGLFLARLAAAEGDQACDRVTGLLATSLTSAGGGVTGPGVAGAPVITSAPVIQAGAGQNYSYGVVASDPQGATLVYSLVGAPTGMIINESGAIGWLKPVAGTYNVTVRADNGKAYAEQRYQLTVSAEALELTASLAVTPAVVNLGESVNIDLVTNGGTGALTTIVNVDGQPVVLDVAGHATLTASTGGAHQVSVSVTDAIRTVTRNGTYSVRDLADSTRPVAVIASPADDAEISGPVNVTGTASAASMAYYQLLLRPSGSTALDEIARGTTAVNNGVLGKLDPTQLANGIYDLVLVVADANGNKQSTVITLDVYRDLKIGQFAITFEDLNVEALGIPIRVTRTYDTRNKSRSLDFGYGWSVDYQSAQISKNMVLGLQWEISQRQLLLCVVPAGKRKINITLPDGKVQRFTAQNADECAFGTIPPVDIQLIPMPGTTSRLEIANVGNIEARGGVLYDMDNLEPWNPHEYKLTTEDDYVYYLTDGVGITSVRDPGGNTLTYGVNGIVHSSGQSVAFTRDANKRITSITDPAGKRISYAYSGAGDLVSVTNRTAAVSKFSYNRSHGLTGYTDPLGIMKARYVYDAEGRLVATYDADGKAVEAVHDTANKKEIIKDRRGNATTYVYNDNGDITEKIDALNHKTTFVYDALGNPASTTDANGQTTVREFDKKTGKILSEKDPLGNTTTALYDSGTGTRLQSATDARNNVTTFMSSLGGSQSVTEPLGRTTHIAMNGGKLEAITIAGQVTRNTFDANGNRVTETDAGGNVTTFGYDANGKETSRSWNRTVDGVVKIISSTRKLDAEGRILEETDALGFTDKFAYNAGGQIISSTDAQGRKTSFEYNQRGKSVKTIYPDGTSEAVAYDAENNRTNATDRQGRQTQYEYDALNRLVRTIYPDGSTNAIEYDPVGRVRATIDAANRRTVSTYDAAGRLETVTDPAQKVTRFGYDENGNRTSATDANQQLTTYKYDELNRLVLTTAPDGKTTSIVWNINGTKKSETDFGGSVTAYEYDATRHLNKVSQTDGATAQTTVYQYDNLGNKTSQTDAEGHVTRWAYDALDRVASRTLPGGQVERFGYDSVGNLTSKTDFAGQVTRFAYAVTGEVNLVMRADGASIATTYTPNGKVESTTVSGGLGVQGGKTAYSYDANDRITKQSNPDGSFIAYGYDANGKVKERTTDAGTVRYAYDENQRLSSVLDVDGKATGYTYEATGKPETVTTPNGVTARYRYDGNGRLQQLLHTRADGSIVTGVRYALKANGQRERVEEYDAQSVELGGVANNPARVSDYQYDSTGRLSQEKLSLRGGAVSSTTDYTFDKVGNRARKTVATPAGTEVTTYTYDSNDRLSQESVTTPTGSVVLTGYQWDAKGNLKSKTVGATSTFYAWSSDDRLIEVRQGASEALAQTIAKYVYDANGNRVGKTVPAATGPAAVTSYLTDSTFPYAQTLQESTVQGSTKSTVMYVWGDTLIARSAAGEQQYYHADGQGSVKALTGAAGDITDTYSYDGFGSIAARAGETVNPYRYTGEYADDTSGLQYNRARWYDAAAGRFISVDPAVGLARVPLSLNKYLYADADAVNKSDPTGLQTLGELNAGMNAEADLGAAAARDMMQGAFKKFGCELGSALAEEVVTNGIYVLMDSVTGQLYVGQSIDIDARYKQHLNEAKKSAKSAWKATSTIIARFHIPGIGTALDKAEQLVMDILEEEGEKLLNRRKQIGNKGKLRPEYNRFKKIICPGSKI